MIEHSATMKVMLSAYGAIDRERGATQSAVVEDMLGCVRCGLESAVQFAKRFHQKLFSLLVFFAFPNQLVCLVRIVEFRPGGVCSTLMIVPSASLRI